MSDNLPWSHGPLRVSSNGRFVEHSDSTPFFWLGDTGWLLFSRLDREEAATYLDDRKAKGFNVIQVMMVHRLPATNIYGRTVDALEDVDWRTGPSMSDRDDYWAVLDVMVRMAEDRGLYMAMVPVWGSVVQEGHLSATAARAYGAWLGSHFGDRPNVIWLNGGDIRGDIKPEVWNELGASIKAHDQQHIMTYHPIGRTRSAEWFHSEPWLDFNMFQSGHRRYDQELLQATGGASDDNPQPETEWRGEDNWRYVLDDLAMAPQKPTIDGEPSYEGIPQGLHDLSQPLWGAADVRRYAYWSVLAGAFGYTYGNNSVMQMHKPEFAPGAFGASATWDTAIADPGAGQMQHLRHLVGGFDYGHGAHSPEILVGDPGERYDRLIANSGPGYAMIYAYTPRPMVVDLVRALPGAASVLASWFNPATGQTSEIGTVAATPAADFDPGVPPAAGNDRVLLLTNG